MSKKDLTRGEELLLDLNPHKRIKVPDDIPHPTAQLCYKQKLDPPNAFFRCDRKLNHSGKHSWEP